MRANDEKANDRQTSAQRQPSARSSSPQHPGAAAQLLALQSTVGNRTVVQLMRDAGDPWLADKHQHSAGCGHQQPATASKPAAQQSGQVSGPNSNSNSTPNPETPPIQRSPTPEQDPTQPTSVPKVLRTTGRPLDATTRADMQRRLGADFSDVRVHDDAAARASAAEIGARAYTSGSHIVIGPGGGDKHTLAHELTHVIQQRQGPVAGSVGASGLKVSDPSDRFERQAEANARRVMSGGSSLLAAGHSHTTQGGQQDDGVQQSTVQQKSTIQRARYAPGETVTADPGFCVILGASLNGTHLGHYSSETTSYSPQDHAEDQLCDEIESAIMFAESGHLGVATQGAGGDILQALTRRMDEGRHSHTLRIRLSASPCSTRQGTTTKHHEGCAERLIYLAGLRFGHDRRQRIVIKISANHLYQPRHLGREARAASRAAINDMRAAGIEVEVG